MFFNLYLTQKIIGIKNQAIPKPSDPFIFNTYYDDNILNLVDHD